MSQGAQEGRDTQRWGAWVREQATESQGKGKKKWRSSENEN